jgi:hypothetical protein
MGAERRSGTDDKWLADLGIEEGELEETARAIQQAKAQPSRVCANRQHVEAPIACRPPLLTPKFAPLAPGASRQESRD